MLHMLNTSHRNREHAQTGEAVPCTDAPDMTPVADDDQFWSKVDSEYSEWKDGF